MEGFKRGDIVRCLRDYPYGAQIKEGMLAIVIDDKGEDDLTYDNYPTEGFAWAGSRGDFVLENLIVENE